MKKIIIAMCFARAFKIINLLILLILISCSSDRNYTVRGVILEIQMEKHKLLIQHDEITGFMMAMTMPFNVHESVDLSEFAIGDSVHFQLVITGNTTYSQKFVVVSHRDPEVLEVYEDWESDPFDPLEMGDLIDDGTFITLDSTEVSLSDWGGQHLFISYLFTRCPMPNMCPALVVKNQYLANELKNENIHFAVISFDYLYDTPSLMQDFYGSLNEQYTNMTFLSSVGHLDDLNLLTRQSGMHFWGVYENNIGHSMRSVLISPEGRLLAAFDGMDWLAGEVIHEIKNFLVMAPN